MKGVPGVLRRGIIQPRYILAIIIVLIAIMVSMGLYELSASRRDIMQVLREEAFSLAEAISIMGDNSLVCFNEIEDLLAERLLDNARILERLDYAGQLSAGFLGYVVERNNVYQIHVFDQEGREVLNARQQDTSSSSGRLFSTQSIDPLLEGVEDEVIIRPGEYDVESYAVGVRRRRGGAIVLSADAREMLAFRRSAGIGNLIQNIGENEGIEYIVLQDEIGLILASRNVAQMRKIAGDDFLEGALRDRVLQTRVYPFANEEVLEVVSPFQIDYTSYGLFRIGLSMEGVRAVESRGRQRLLLTALVVLVASVISLSLLLISQNYSLLSRAYDRMQSYTGMVLENIADGIVVSDHKGLISVFNRAAEQIFGRTDQETIGKPLDELGPEIRQAFEDASKDEVSTSEVTVRSAESGHRLLSIRSSRIAGTEDDTDSAVAIIRDVTEAKLMEENMRRTEQLTAMGKLASAVAHEVRNPLNAISMIAQRLGREFAPREHQEKYDGLVSMIRSESVRINGIIEEFLQFARPPRLNRQPADMDQLLDEVVSLVKAQAADEGVEIHKACSGLGVWIVDTEQMRQALLNLLLNGIEAMPDGGVLSVRTCPAAGLCLEISDTGKGIPEEDIPRIFDLYFTTKETGTGLGLSIVQRTIMEHGGWVDVESAPGTGTTFRIYLPEEARADE